MKFNIGDEVVYKANKDNFEEPFLIPEVSTGEVVDIEGDVITVNWNLEALRPMEDGQSFPYYDCVNGEEYKNIWRVLSDAIIHATSQEDRVCKKIQQMYAKRKQLGYSF